MIKRKKIGKVSTMEKYERSRRDITLIYENLHLMGKFRRTESRAINCCQEHKSIRPGISSRISAVIKLGARVYIYWVSVL